MTALAVGTPRRRRNDGDIKFATYLMTASKTIYEGSLVCIIATTGLAEAAADTSGFRCVGVSTETKVSAATGSFYITVAYGHEELFATGSTLVGAVDVAVCVSDDNVVEVIGTTVNDVKVGPVKQAMSSTLAWIEIRGATPL